MKNILVLLILVLGLEASFYGEHISRDREALILRNFDIDESFYNDKSFRKIKETYENHKTKLFVSILSNAYIYIPMIKKMLYDAGLPEEMVYLAMAESSFKVRAYSKAKAVGIWQFMPGTGRLYNLKINSYIDERRDPIKSTEAAIAYLKSLHNKFGKWYLAMMAYNAGPGRVERAIKWAKSDKLQDLLAIRKGKRRQYLPKETRGYIRKIVAMAFVLENEKLMHNFNSTHLLNQGSFSPLVKVGVRPGTLLSDVAQAIKMTTKELKKYNAFLRYGFTPPFGNSFEIYIPYSKLTFFKQNYKNISHRKYYVYFIKKGDTLSSIGDKFNVPYRVIKDFNRLKSNSLRINQRLTIPSIKLKKAKYKAIVQANNQTYYKIRKGDTLESIARRFNTKIKRLKRINRIKDVKKLQINHKIIIK